MADEASTTVSLEEGYRLCRKISRRQFSDYTWVVGNLPRDVRRHVFALTAFLARAIELMDTDVGALARKEEWMEWRDALRDAFRGQPGDVQLAALAATAEQYEVSREYLFDIQAGVELAIRCQRFEAFDQWLQLASRIGGSTMLAGVSILGFEKSGYEETAMACGEALFLTQLLDEMGNGHHNVLLYVPRLLARQCNVHLEALNPKRPSQEFVRLVRVLVSRIEPRFHVGGKLVPYLSFDGRRVMRSLIAMHWQILMKIKAEPASILQRRHQLTRRELFTLQFKHVMGVEGGVPVLQWDEEDHLAHTPGI